MRNMTLPTNSAERKEVPLFSGCLAYFPAALAGVARHSKLGNDQHHPGEPLHHARGKSVDHEDCILRHLTDLSDMLAARSRAAAFNEAEPDPVEYILEEADALAWRALALSQQLHERFGGAPLAPGARLSEPFTPEGAISNCTLQGKTESGFTPITDMTEEDRELEPAEETPTTAPFDLQKALAGCPLVTRDGQRVTDFRDSLPSSDIFPYTATVHLGYGPVPASYTATGTFFFGDIPHPADLFMDLRDQRA